MFKDEARSVKENSSSGGSRSSSDPPIPHAHSSYSGSSDTPIPHAHSAYSGSSDGSSSGGIDPSTPYARSSSSDAPIPQAHSSYSSTFFSNETGAGVAVWLVVSAPYLLTQSPGTLAAKVVGLAKLMGMTVTGAKQVCVCVCVCVCVMGLTVTGAKEVCVCFVCVCIIFVCAAVCVLFMARTVLECNAGNDWIPGPTVPTDD